MSGFSAEWLALREPADHRARNPEVLAGLSSHFSSQTEIAIVDLGCGAGSNLRALAPTLPMNQRWRLVDYDPALLAAAGGRIAAWADRAETSGSDLKARKGDRELTISFVQADLSAGADAVLDGRPDLVTAAALFDLVSARWIERFAPAVAAIGAVFYTALTYDGREAWAPPHPDDSAMLAAFHAHQGGDKGFGPSAGPKAAGLLAEAFARAGYDVRTGDSPWRLGADDAALVRQLAEGVAGAVRETGRLPDDRVADWLAARLSGASCLVGHADLLAVPHL